MARFRRSNDDCTNCGRYGHVARDCTEPITSFGLIAFKIVDKPQDCVNDVNAYTQSLFSYNVKTPSFPHVKYLMINRQNTIAYVDFLRGKYTTSDRNNLTIIDEIRHNADKGTDYGLLCRYFDEMTTEEKHKLLTYSFDELWDDLWKNKNASSYKNDYHLAKARFDQIPIEYMITNSTNLYNHCEFSFAKGRKHVHEAIRKCAEREFCEETGYSRNDFYYVTHDQIVEVFKGSNDTMYKHVYFLVRMKDGIHPPNVDISNLTQVGEVSNVAWLTFNECIDLIRPYDMTKLQILTQLENEFKLEFLTRKRKFNKRYAFQRKYGL